MYELNSNVFFVSSRTTTDSDINDNNTVSLVLLGNKCDLEYNRKVSYEEGKEYADKNNMIFYETCALNGYNVLEGLHWGILGYHQNKIFLGWE